VGITARVLGDLNKLDSPEGVTILGGAVVDDVLGILILAVIVGIETTGVLSGIGILIISVKAIAFLLFVSVAGSWASPWISSLIMRLGKKEGFYSEPSIQLCLSLALVFLISGLAEKYFGLAMIIGSYSLGLALSGTPLFQQIKTPIHRLNGVVVPIFFTVVGMQVNLKAIFEGNSNSVVNALLFAVALSILGIISKLAGCGLPALLVGFNRSESWKIGVGMIPRGEVALIIGGIALASGVISQQIFGVTIIMTLVTTIIAPIMLVRSYR